jgi:hypothetical protein
MSLFKCRGQIGELSLRITSQPYTPPRYRLGNSFFYETLLHPAGSVRAPHPLTDPQNIPRSTTRVRAHRSRLQSLSLRSGQEILPRAARLHNTSGSRYLEESVSSAASQAAVSDSVIRS